MNQTVEHSELIEPGQRVAVFQEHAASGATIGYHGMVVERRSSLGLGKAWYRLWVPALNREIERPEDEIFVVPIPSEDTVLSGRSDRPLWEIRFEASPDDDSLVLRGVYRKPGKRWDGFEFRKWRRNYPSYWLRKPGAGQRMRQGLITFRVPERTRLTRGYALWSLAEVLGVD